MAVSDYNTNPDLNTSIGGINIAEGCAPSGINNAIRQLMADVKTADNANVKTSGNQTISDAKTFSGTVTIAAGGTLTVSGSNTFRDDVNVQKANPYVNTVETDVTRGSGGDGGATAYQGLRCFDKTGSALIGETVARCYSSSDQMWLRAVSPDGQSDAILKVICNDSSGFAQLAAGGTSSILATQSFVASEYLPKSGGTISGVLSISSGGYIDLKGPNTNIPSTTASNASKYLRGDGNWADVASAGTITSTLPVSLGGTGKTAFTNTNGVVTAAGTSTGDLTAVATKNGALYATSSGGVASFGTLPIAQGGTGATTQTSAFHNLTSTNVGTSATHLITITSSWGKCGYTAVSDAKTVLGIPDIQRGSATLYTSGTSVAAGANKDVSVTFPHSFGGVPTIIGVARGGNNSYALYENVSVYSISKTAVTFRCRNVVSAYTASAASYVEWIAMY